MHPLSFNAIQVSNMIFIDFEGYVNKNPSLAGYQIGNEFKQIILDTKLVNISQETDIGFQDYENFCRWIISQSNELNQPITAWSENELEIFSQFQTPFDYCNLLKEAKKKIRKNADLSKKHKTMNEYWIGQNLNIAGNNNPHANPFKRKRWKLLTILKLLDYPELNTGYGTGLVTARLRAIENGLGARGSYKKLTRVQKSKWTKLLNHNKVDVDGMLFIKDKLELSFK